MTSAKEFRNQLNIKPKINFKAVPNTRRAPLIPSETALLIIDVQNWGCIPGFGLHSSVDPSNVSPKYDYFFDRVKKIVLPNIKKLLVEFRAQDIDIIFTCMESLTSDGRDLSADYKLSGIHIPRGSLGAQVCDEIKPEGANEIYLPKTACSVFNSTNLDYVLRNLGTKYLVITGLLTNQCIESAVRDAADRGFLVYLCEDCCSARTLVDHENSLKNCAGFANITTTEAVINELITRRSKL